MRIKSLEFLVDKSRSLLGEQQMSYENCTKKSGMLLSGLAIFIPLSISLMVNNETLYWQKLLAIIPIGLAIYSINDLLSVLKPKRLGHGFNFEEFGKQAQKPYLQLLIFEVKANRSTYNLNARVIDAQLSKFKSSVTHFVYSVTSLFIILIINLIFHY